MPQVWRAAPGSAAAGVRGEGTASGGYGGGGTHGVVSGDEGGEGGGGTGRGGMANFHHRDEGPRTDILPALQKISPLSVVYSHGVSQLVGQSVKEERLVRGDCQVGWKEERKMMLTGEENARKENGGRRGD